MYRINSFIAVASTDVALEVARYFFVSEAGTSEWIGYVVKLLGHSRYSIILLLIIGSDVCGTA